MRLPLFARPLPSADSLATDDQIRAFLMEPRDGTSADAATESLARAALSVAGYSLSREQVTHRLALRNMAIEFACRGR